MTDAMREVYDLGRRVADVNASVLITGESGAGKELIARAIHNSSSGKRRSGENVDRPLGELRQQANQPRSSPVSTPLRKTNA